MNVSAIIAALVSVGSMVSIATGHPLLAAVFTDPATAQELTSIVGGGAALVSAFSGAIHLPVTPVKK